LIDALGADASLRCVVAGEGPERDHLQRLARERGLDGRATFAGRVSEQELADLYARCLAVYYAPVDEDFGMVPYEAFLAQKPVVTTTDAGGPLEVVGDRETGLVCEPTATAVAEAFVWLRDHPDEARKWGRAGQRAAEQLTWDAAIDRLLA
jgi:glycosyltransferase involved in cell wall biosynthesis